MLCKLGAPDQGDLRGVKKTDDPILVVVEGFGMDFVELGGVRDDPQQGLDQ